MTVLFGTVEYFEREIEFHLTDVEKRERFQEEIQQIQMKLEEELRNDFICDERLRRECLENLSNACSKLTEDYVV
ncbi:hypothetical protein QNH36_20105 [Mesobacillus sp. AQ2]|uniref:hypothetical protein n=1 Tax=Bacillaceae TaxID=186817 RepID=UPI0011A22329|nr:MULTISPECIES: hypothetical protein [Bacillaceae]MCM3125095.1 hypothetical protein [Mesobacillus sp. MER 33]MCM3235145.1 hypothetical protein [Mesobacillus sp. MER 48]WHX39923.1 hypothetical protein QNH36_20105 [Mesobacillus sp. AQ2]